MRNQDQSAGDHSQQFQAGRDITIQGISASDVITITRAEIDRVIQELTLTAESVARARAEAFERRVVEQFEENLQLRAAFADPGFQFSLRDASRAAVSSDDQHTEDLLLDLLTNRAEQGNEFRVRLATSRAIRVAEDLSLDALHGLTALWAITSLRATETGVDSELDSARGVAEGLIAMGIPSDHNWIDDADALNLIRVSTGGVESRKSYVAFLQQRVPEDLVPGVEEGRFNEVVQAAGGLGGERLKACARPHPLKPGFVALVGESQAAFRSRLPPATVELPDVVSLVSENGFGKQDPTAVQEFAKRVQALPPLRKIASWWDRVPVVHLKLTGTVIGFVNARRYVQWGGARTIGDLLAPPER